MNNSRSLPRVLLAALLVLVFGLALGSAPGCYHVPDITKPAAAASPALEGDPDFVGPVRPLTIQQRRAAADADGDKITERWTGRLIDFLCIGSVVMLALSFLFPWASIRVALIGAAGAVVVTVFRSALLAYGPLMRDGLVAGGVLYAGYTVVHYIKLHQAIKAGTVAPSPTPLAHLVAKFSGLFASPATPTK